MKTMNSLQEITEWEIFEEYQEPQYNYKTFEVLQSQMDSGTIKDTPEGAYILAKQICEDCLEEVMNRSKCGFVVKHQGNYLHCDLHILQGGSVGGSFRSTNSNSEIFPFEESLEEIFEVVKRQY